MGKNEPELPRILETLGIKVPDGRFGKNWWAAERTYSEKRVGFLTPAFVKAQTGALGMGKDLAEALLSGLRLFRDVPVLRRLAWHCHRQLFHRKRWSGSVGKDWPEIPEVVHGYAPLFYVYVFMSGVPDVLRRQGALGIAREITIDTLSDMELWTRDYRAKHGRWGFAQVGWLSLHFSSQIFKLGRLQFNFGRHNLPFTMYRNVKDGKVVALAHKGLPFRTDGQFDGVNGISDPAAWRSVFDDAGDAVTGTPISPLGRALQATVTLPKKEWMCIFKPGDTALGTHIPATGPMGHEACGKSFMQAVEFFGKHFPAHQIHAFMCTSWLLDPQFEQWMKPESNIVKFLQEWYLLPYRWASDHSFFDRIFGGPVADIDKAPQETSLQKAIVAHIRAGGHWRNTSAVLFPQDLGWGKQVYRTTRCFVK